MLLYQMTVVASAQGEMSQLLESHWRSCLTALVQRGAVPPEPEEGRRAPEEAEAEVHLGPRGLPQVGSGVGCSGPGSPVGCSRAGVQGQAPALTPGIQTIQAEDLGQKLLSCRPMASLLPQNPGFLFLAPGQWSLP